MSGNDANALINAAFQETRNENWEGVSFCEERGAVAQDKAFPEWIPPISVVKNGYLGTHELLCSDCRLQGILCITFQRAEVAVPREILEMILKKNDHLELYSKGGAD